MLLILATAFLAHAADIPLGGKYHLKSDDCILNGSSPNAVEPMTVQILASEQKLILAQTVKDKDTTRDFHYWYHEVGTRDFGAGSADLHEVGAYSPDKTQFVDTQYDEWDADKPSNVSRSVTYTLTGDTIKIEYHEGGFNPAICVGTRVP